MLERTIATPRKKRPKPRASPPQKKTTSQKKSGPAIHRKKEEEREKSASARPKSQNNKRKRSPNSSDKRKTSVKPIKQREQPVAVVRPPSRKRQILRFIFDILFYVVMVGIIIGTLVFSFSGDDNRSLFGYRFYNV